MTPKRSWETVLTDITGGSRSTCRVANRPFCAAIGVTLGGERDILGLWAGTGGLASLT